jgi:ArsR family transcriptional regulator
MNNIKISQVLSDPIRYKILMMLVRSENSCCSVIGYNDEPYMGLCNCVIMSELSMIQSRVSYHMKELVESGLVNEEPRGKWKYYFLNSKRLTDYIDQLKQDFNLK